MSTFSVVPNLLPHTDFRYIKWRESLKKRPGPWNKGKTKKTDQSVKKISDTFKRKKLDNFFLWREKMIASGKIISSYPIFAKSGRLAFLIGITLGDGNIYRFPRTEKLTITLGLDKPDLIRFTKDLVEEIFNKEPQARKDNFSQAARITLYQNQISKRLEIPSGNRRYSKKGIPKWVWSSDSYLKNCLRGLFEAEGSLSIHLPTCTYNFAFSNLNPKLLGDVRKALIRLKLHPEVRSNAIRLRKRAEVQYFRDLIQFRDYHCGIC